MSNGHAEDPGVRVNKRSIAIGLVWTLVVGLGVPSDSRALDKERYIVRFKSHVSGQLSSKAFSTQEASRAERELPLDNSVVMKLSPEQRVALESNPDVESIEVDHKIRAYFNPNDPSFPSQRGLNGTYSISPKSAWDITAGSTTKIVAVIDSGIDFTHEDLQETIWSNPGEIASNGIDDDGNGFIDDVRGYDFGSDSGDSDPTDENGHGTHVAGIIAATGNNGLGVIGVAWRTNIIPVKCLDDSGNGYLSYLVNALDYVVTLKDQGYPIAVVNMSLGTDEHSEALTRAVGRVSSRGILLVAAAGNNFGRNNDETPSFPANTEDPNVIAVAASNTAGSLASFSNYGPTTVDLVAPGSSILSTVPLALKGQRYDYLDGTSMATPHVSGVAALVAAANPKATPALIKGILFATVLPRSTLTGKVVTGGIVNARSAVAVGFASKSKYRLTGSVKRHGKGMSKVAMTLKRSSSVMYRRATTTSASGRFSFSDVPAGTYTITPTRSGVRFSVTSQRVAVTTNKQVTFTAR